MRSLAEIGAVHFSGIEAQAFDGIIPALNAGKFDAIIASMSITQKRQEAVMFPVPYANMGQIFMTLKTDAIGELGDTPHIFPETASPGDLGEHKSPPVSVAHHVHHVLVASTAGLQWRLGCRV